MGNHCWLVTLGLVACSGSTSDAHGTAGSGSASAGNNAAGASSASGGAVSNGGSPSAHGGAANSAAGTPSGGDGTFTAVTVSKPAQLRGDLTIQQYSPDNVSFGTNIGIYFSDVRGQWDGCTRYQLGECGYYDCPSGSNPPGAGVPPIYYDGGTATITGLPPAVVAPFSDTTGLLLAHPQQQLWPIAGGMVSIAVTGGDLVPAFTMQLQTPPMLRMLTINGAAAPTSVKRSDGMHLTWASSGPGTAAFFVVALSGQHPAAVCQFEASANAGELPAAVLSHLDLGPEHSLVFRGQTSLDMPVGSWSMEAAAYTLDEALSGSVTPSIELE